MNISDNGISLIKRFEGCRSQSYQDSVGIWTIGYGHTGLEVVKGLTWTPKQIDFALQSDLRRFCDAVTEAVKVPLTQNQFDALVSFSFNVGITALRRSTLLRLLNAGNYTEAADQFLKWTKAGGKDLPGLVKRRVAERELFRK